MNKKDVRVFKPNVNSMTRERRVMVIDCETTGVNVYTDKPIQIGWGLYVNEKERSVGDVFVRTDSLPELITEITGITQKYLDKNGVRDSVAANCIYAVIKNFDPDVLVGHNLFAFDLMIIQNWMHRNLKGIFRLPQINQAYDTMMSSRKILGTKKWPKLIELALALGIEIEKKKTHEAKYDIELTSKCYFAMQKFEAEPTYQELDKVQNIPLKFERDKVS